MIGRARGAEQGFPMEAFAPLARLRGDGVYYDSGGIYVPDGGVGREGVWRVGHGFVEPGGGGVPFFFCRVRLPWSV